MPRWAFHSKAFLYFRRRFRVNADPQELLTGIIPTATIDRTWPRDAREIWGVFGQVLSVLNEFCGVELVAQRRALRVHRITAWYGVGDYPFTGQKLHLFTPLQTYDPTANNTTLWLPWLQTHYAFGQAAQLGEAFVLAGTAPAQQVVNVNGVPFTSIGPMRTQGGTTGAVTNNAKTDDLILWDDQDPPLYVQPFTSICVQQFYAGLANNTYNLNVSFFYSEDEEVA